MEEPEASSHFSSMELLLCDKRTFELEGVKIHEEISGTSKQDSFGLRHLLVKSRFTRPPKEGRQHVHTSLSPRT